MSLIFTICWIVLLPAFDTHSDPSVATAMSEGEFPTLMMAPLAKKDADEAAPPPAALAGVTVNVYEGTVVESPVNGILVAAVAG